MSTWDELEFACNGRMTALVSRPDLVGFELVEMTGRTYEFLHYTLGGNFDRYFAHAYGNTAGIDIWWLDFTTELDEPNHRIRRVVADAADVPQGLVVTLRGPAIITGVNLATGDTTSFEPKFIDDLGISPDEIDIKVEDL
jgi:hypothetical protein